MLSPTQTPQNSLARWPVAAKTRLAKKIAVRLIRALWHVRRRVRDGEVVIRHAWPTRATRAVRPARAAWTHWPTARGWHHVRGHVVLRGSAVHHPMVWWSAWTGLIVVHRVGRRALAIRLLVWSARTFDIQTRNNTKTRAQNSKRR